MIRGPVEQEKNVDACEKIRILAGLHGPAGRLMSTVDGQQKPFAPVSILDIPTIAGRPVQLDSKGKLLPWPMAENTGYSYSSYFLSQWTIVWDQYNRQRLP